MSTIDESKFNERLEQARNYLTLAYKSENPELINYWQGYLDALSGIPIEVIKR
jgi:hypothetical protein